jgi:uncharacterized delta-60 repeat protein
MTKNSTAQPAPARRNPSEGGFFNLRVLISIVLFTGCVLLTLFARESTQTKEWPHAPGSAADVVPPDLPQGYRSSVRRSGTHSYGTSLAPSGSVQEEWVARYNGTANYFDVATGIAVDGSGNIYVVGTSFGSDTSYDYATIKYNASGTEEWVARYNGPGNDVDQAYAIAADGSGNVYVTGASTGSGGDHDYATIKYNASGTEEWVARYNGPGGDFDEAYAIAVDGSGNVYVTGGSVGSGGDPDYATIKYDASGTEEWVARYNGPGTGEDIAFAIAIDDSGNVYVTGTSVGSGTGYDCATIKYNASGTEEWVARYNGPGNDFDLAKAIAVDGSGNVYVTGRTTASPFNFDYATIKYDASGTEQWVASYNGPGNDYDSGNAIALDGSGNVYVTGGSTGVGTSSDYATIKYNASGTEQWVARYNGPGNDYDDGHAIAVDGSGNVYVTGGSAGSGTSFDYATIRYDASGTEEWVARYNYPENAEDVANAIAFDSSGYVYVTGGSVGSGTNSDFATIKYSQSPSATPSPTPTSTASATPTSTPRPRPTPRPHPTPPPRPTPSR